MILYEISPFYLIASLIILKQIWCFESLLDNDFYNINWKGPMQLQDDDETTVKPLKQDSIIVTTNNKEKYRCVLPNVDSKSRSMFQESFSSAKLELDFLRILLDSNICMHRLEIYWTYEFCHGRHIRQYHEEKEIGKLPVVQEYYLGRYNREQFNQDLKKAKEKRKEGSEFDPPVIKVQGMDMPYYEVIYEGGTTCDLNNVARRSHVFYVCYPEAKGEIYELKETSSCEYEIIVLTSALCQHPSYGPRKDPVHGINCHALNDASRRPLNLEVFELQNSLGGYKSPEEEIAGAIWDIVRAHAEEERVKIKTVTSNINSDKDDNNQQQKDDDNLKQKEVKGDTELQAPSEPLFSGQPSSRQIIVDFFNGDYCIQGGSGWWKHEFCFGKYVRQFHEDQKGRATITLGLWDKSKHLEWLQRNPSRKPKSTQERKSLYNFYGGGATCEETGRPRSVEVRFDCSKHSEASNAISLYLIEYVLCQYKLIVEASLFCDVIGNTGDDGVIHFKN